MKSNINFVIIFGFLFINGILLLSWTFNELALMNYIVTARIVSFIVAFIDLVVMLFFVMGAIKIGKIE